MLVGIKGNTQDQIAQFSYLKESLLALSSDWLTLLFAEPKVAEALLALDDKLTKLSLVHTLCPPRHLVFRALQQVDLTTLKVVILGQDPYHGKQEANGLAFSVNPGVKLPPSLKNILTEILTEYQHPVNLRAISELGSDLLFKWTRQGVLLLNSTLSVVENQANSLSNIGFEHVTDTIIRAISTTCSNVVFLLWGNFAHKKTQLINHKHHLILKAAHPSPLSAYRGFFGCNHFVLANEYLLQHNKDPVNWLG